MSDPTNAEPIGTDLIHRPASTAVMTPEQFDATWRMSKALANSGSFKDIGREDGSKALARILLGADLGMSPTQALMGIDIVKGNPQIRGVALGRMVRNSARKPLPTGESYDYAVLDRGFMPGEEYAVVALYRRDEDGAWPRVEGDPVVFPTSVGPITVKTGERLPEAVEAFQITQALKRKLVKLDGAWDQQPEVMVVWRALSQLVRFYAPDVIGGVGVYTEADSHPRAIDLAGSGSGEGPGWGEMSVETAREVMNVIERAKTVGHAGLSDTATIQQRLNGQPPEVVAQWITDSTATLNGMATPEPPDAEVVEDGPAPEPLIVTLDGETFDLGDAPEWFHMIMAAITEGPAAMEQMALALMDAADAAEADENMERAERFRTLGGALHAEAGQG